MAENLATSRVAMARRVCNQQPHIGGTAAASCAQSPHGGEAPLCIIDIDRVYMRLAPGYSFGHIDAEVGGLAVRRRAGDRRVLVAHMHRIDTGYAQQGLSGRAVLQT